MLALSQKDIKLLLSYSTVSQLGLIIIGLNLGNDFSINGSIVHIINHAVFKSILFMCAGIIIENYKTRDISNIKGVFRRLPLVGILLTVSMLALAGAPFTSGAYSKYLILYQVDSLLINGVVNAINIGTIVVMFRVSMILYGKSESSDEVHITNNRKVVLSVLLIAFVLLSVFVDDIYRYIFEQVKTISMIDHMKKSIIFVCGILISITMHRFGVYKLKLFDKIGKVDLGFNTIALSIPLFNAALFVYLVLSSS